MLQSDDSAAGTRAADERTRPMTTTPKTPPAALSRYARLAADAADAAQLRALTTDPDVVALQAEKIRRQVDILLAAAIYLGLAFTMSNVQAFAARGAALGSTTWWAAWLLDPIPSLALLAVLRAEKITARYQLALPVWAKRTKWLAFTSTYVMNTWTSWGLNDQPLSWAGIVLHSVPPLVVLFTAEAGPGIRDTLTDAVRRSALAAREGVDKQKPSHRDGDGARPQLHESNDGTDAAAEVDPRVHEVSHLLRDGETHTGESIATRFGVSPRTGRRILRAAEAAAPCPPTTEMNPELASAVRRTCIPQQPPPTS